MFRLEIYVLTKAKLASGITIAQKGAAAPVVPVVPDGDAVEHTGRQLPGGLGPLLDGVVPEDLRGRPPPPIESI